LVDQESLKVGQIGLVQISVAGEFVAVVHTFDFGPVGNMLQGLVTAEQEVLIGFFHYYRSQRCKFD
jgi:hypothetical protein